MGGLPHHGIVDGAHNDCATRRYDCRVIHIHSSSRFPHVLLSYYSCMNGYGYYDASDHSEVRDYVQRSLAEQAASKAAACQQLFTRVRTERTPCFALDTALELYAIERPRHSTLSASEFRAVVQDSQQRSDLSNVDYRTWSQPFATYTFANGLTCVHPIDTWIQYAQYLDLTELVVLGEAIIRRFKYSVDAFRKRLHSFKRITGRKRCEAALALIQSSDSVQETRVRLVLLQYGLPAPQTQYVIASTDKRCQYTVDMAYPNHMVVIEYDGDHHRRFRNQYIRDQRKRRDLRSMGWTVIEVFADDLYKEADQQSFVQNIANAMKIPLTGIPQRQFCTLVDPRLKPNARRGEYRRQQYLRNTTNR